MEILKNLRKKSLAGILHVLLNSLYSVLFDVNSSDKKVDHIAG